MGRIISFKGKISDGGQETIALQTNNGLIGYKITKFEAIPESPGTSSSNHILKIYKVKQDTVTSTIDFADNRLVGSLWLRDNIDANYVGAIESVIFDNEKFNQDIYVTHVETVGTKEVNYYIELEQSTLDLNEQTVATLKDIRNNKVPS